jgi:hypothetical protein
VNQVTADTEISQAMDDGPALARDPHGEVDYDSIPDVVQWFLDYDQRVAVIKHPSVEELFQWKQQQSEVAGEEVFKFNRAEDRFAVGVIQAIAYNPSESDLHAWITQLLNALDSASKATENTTVAYHLELKGANSVVVESNKIPAARARTDFLINCWLETLCTAEIRVLGWLYQEIYGRPFHPSTF